MQAGVRLNTCVPPRAWSGQTRTCASACIAIDVSALSPSLKFNKNRSNVTLLSKCTHGYRWESGEFFERIQKLIRHAGERKGGCFPGSSSSLFGQDDEGRNAGDDVSLFSELRIAEDGAQRLAGVDEHARGGVLRGRRVVRHVRAARVNPHAQIVERVPVSSRIIKTRRKRK